MSNNTQNEFSLNKINDLLSAPELILNKFGINTLSRIHKYLFEEVYPFAGEIRNVDITKGGTYFARFQYIEPELDKILKEMKSLNKVNLVK